MRKTTITYSGFRNSDKNPNNPNFKELQETLVKNISPVFFQPVSAALLLLETAVIAPVLVMFPLDAFLTPLLATVLQLKEPAPPK